MTDATHRPPASGDLNHSQDETRGGAFWTAAGTQRSARIGSVDGILHEASARGYRFVDLHFTDVAGGVKSVVIPAGQLEDALRYGHWFDGSSLEAGARTMETDLLLRPILETWGSLAGTGSGQERTGRLICEVQTPEGEPFPADPRAVLVRVLQDAEDMGFRYHVASEIEFYLFRSGSLDGAVQPADAGAAARTHARPDMPPGAAGPADTGGYFDLPPQGERVRDEIVHAMGDLGVAVESSHHEIGPGQHEIDLPLMPALEAADGIVTCKYAVKAVARRKGLLPTFMPKPAAQAAGSGLHLHQVLTSGDESNALVDATDEHGLSGTGKAFIAGQLAHARAMCAVLAPSVNSYKRIGRGFDAPSYLAWSHSNPYAVVRVPRITSLRQRGQQLNESAMRLELRCPDPSCNPYLALAVALAAGLDGIRSGMELPASVDAPPGHDATLDETQVEVLPASLGEAIGELDWDPVVRNALGAPVYERLLAAKEQEWQEYRRQVSAWELGRYFESS